MSIASTSSVCAIALAISVASGTPRARAQSRQSDQDIKLSGCLVRGEEGGGYLLTNPPSEPAWQRTSDAAVVPSTVGTTGSFATIFYWLKDHDDLKEHVGHMVEVEGDLDGDIEEGAIKIERKDKWTEIRVKSEGRDLRARVPHSSVVSWPSRDKRDVKALVRKVDVDRVRMLSASCQP